MLELGEMGDAIDPARSFWPCSSERGAADEELAPGLGKILVAGNAVSRGREVFQQKLFSASLLPLVSRGRLAERGSAGRGAEAESACAVRAGMEDVVYFFHGNASFRCGNLQKMIALRIRTRIPGSIKIL